MQMFYDFREHFKPAKKKCDERTYMFYYLFHFT